VRDVREALQDAGLDPAAVRLIVNCHLHFDHCGQNRSFPCVPIVVQRREREAARTPGYTVPGVWTSPRHVTSSWTAGASCCLGCASSRRRDIRPVTSP
jgi:glyoxylase-like metal-dependent hydrolase (beta-lactamase superfamily II)